MFMAHQGFISFPIYSFSLLSLCNFSYANSVDGPITESLLKNQQYIKTCESPTDKSNEPASVGKINVSVNSLFDESRKEENTWLYRLANRWHISTKSHVITDDLLFKEHDFFDLSLLETSERILNSRRYITNASVTPIYDECRSDVNVNVSVRETWTLKPEVTFSQSGGKSKYSFGLEDSNFLGTGKAVLIQRFSNAERSGSIYEYSDPNIGSIQSRLNIRYSDNNDGEQTHLNLHRPFIALNTPWAAGFKVSNLSQSTRLYDLGKAAASFHHDISELSVFWGNRIDEVQSVNGGNEVKRVLVGFSHQADSFYYKNTNAVSPMPRYLPNDREFNTAWIELHHARENYFKTFNLQQINRPEYVNLGANSSLRLGYSPNSKLGGRQQESYLFDARYAQNRWLAESYLLSSRFHAKGHLGEKSVFGTTVTAQLEMYWMNRERGQFYTSLEATKGYNLFRDKPLVVGGDTGVRGYPINYQAGDRKVTFTMEQRFFGRKEWFSLFHAGFAVFADAGRAWGQTAVNQSDQGWLKSVGMGLRLSGTRNGSRVDGHPVLHIDIVAPLNNSPNVSEWQWRAGTEHRF